MTTLSWFDSISAAGSNVGPEGVVVVLVDELVDVEVLVLVEGTVRVGLVLVEKRVLVLSDVLVVAAEMLVLAKPLLG